MNIVVNSEAETIKIAKKLGEKVKNGGVICIFGDLGTGKTTFTKGVACANKIEINKIKSPTYTYIRKYDGKCSDLYHIDLYRIEEIDELLIHEINEINENEKNIIVIEWADKIINNLPRKRIEVQIKYLNGNSRKINITQVD